jgi:hypothetical protein
MDYLLVGVRELFGGHEKGAYKQLYFSIYCVLVYLPVFHDHDEVLVRIPIR